MTTPPRRKAQNGRPGTRPRRAAPPPASFLQRNRNRLAVLAAAVVLAAGAAFAYASFTSPAYACNIEWTPQPTPSTAPGATPVLGYTQDDLGRDHVAVGSFVKYLFCPPASGNHYNLAGVAGPIPPKVYGPNETTIPQNWIHNLEHGGLVLLYKCPGDGVACTDAGQQAFTQLFDSWPPSPVCSVPPHEISPIIARFDQMQFNYAALVWDEVLPLDTFNADEIKAFFAQQGERLNPEKQCQAPTPTAAPTASPGPTATPGPTDTSAPSASIASSASTAPSATSAPSPS